MKIYVDVNLHVVRFVTILSIILLPASLIKMVRNDDINAMMESKFDELKNVFTGETKEILNSSIKEEMKTLFTEELPKFKEVSKKMDEITSTNKMLQQHVTSLNVPMKI